jgi:methylated-DNA-[protein]-cysteine S-methyltransferase
MSPSPCALFPTPFGSFLIAWQDTAAGPRVEWIHLPRERDAEEEYYLNKYGTPLDTVPVVAGLASQIVRFLEGEAIQFSLELLTLERCPDFQRRVLLAEYAIPRGWVSTYGRIARHVGVPGGARAVGGALARNPFPIVIPCHRAIAAGGRLGGYQGGLAMKRALLEMEGIEFGPDGRVREGRYYY